MVQALTAQNVNSIWEHSLLDTSAPKHLRKKPQAKDPLQWVLLILVFIVKKFKIMSCNTLIKIEINVLVSYQIIKQKYPNILSTSK